MMKHFKTLLASFIFIFGVASPMVALLAPSTPVNAACDDRVLGIPPWYRGLTAGDDCLIVNPNDVGGPGAFITRLVLNFIEIGVVITAYIAAGFIIYGGFQFLTNGANPSAVEAARKTILNAVIELAIALSAVAILNFIFGITAT